MEEVGGDDTALRRVPELLVISDQKVPGGRRASSSAFKDDPDGSPMSVYLQSVVDELQLPVAAVVHGKGAGWAVAAAPVQVLVEEEQRVVRDPVIDPAASHPCDPAHALVYGEKTPKSRRERIARRSPLVFIVS